MKKYFLIFLLLFLAVSMASATQVRAEDDEMPIVLWDSTVSHLLAAGMYGAEGVEHSSWSVRLSNDNQFYKGFSAYNAAIAGQEITLSYGGSSGLLGFSVGYIYTHHGDEIENSFASVFLDKHDPLEFTADDLTGVWYLALELSSSYSPINNISLGIGGEAMLLNDPHVFQGGKGVALGLNLPVSYRRNITITPKVRWSGSLSGLKRLLPAEGHKGEESPVNDGIFYGGVSITFSY